MSSLALVAVLAAQAATQTGAPPPAPGTAADGTTAPTTHAGQSTYVDLEAGAGYSTNPVLSVGSNSGSAFGRLSAHAVHTRTTDRTTTVVSGFAQSVFYTNGLNSAQSFDLNGRHQAAVNEKLRLFVDGDFAFDRGGQLDTRILSVPDLSLLSGSTVPPAQFARGSDFLSVTGKTYRAGAHIGGQLVLGPRDSFDFSTGIDHSTFRNGLFDTRSTTIPASIGYDRQLNERTSVGTRVVAQFTHYSGVILNGARNFRVITPDVTGQIRLSEKLKFSGDVGVSFSSVDDGLLTRHSTGVTADANLCSATERTQFCGQLSLQQQAATSVGPARVMSAGMDYSRRLGSSDTIQFSLSAVRYSNPILVVAVPSFAHATYVRVAADYSRKVGNRLYGGVDLAARKITQHGPGPDTDLSAAVFIRYRLGDVE
ncbi:MAG TPA: hypothetical protein VGU01_01450 [Sphingomicrobium sp.]|nr:hypothetical protein [Sphingomicrobium sp.]